jgi:DNA-binding CsgD family transcriptional regulator
MQCALIAFAHGFRLSNKGDGMHRHTNGEIARMLGIREQTVKDYVSVLLGKFHARNRVALAVAAVRAGL